MRVSERGMEQKLQITGLSGPYARRTVGLVNDHHLKVQAEDLDLKAGMAARVTIQFRTLTRRAVHTPEEGALQTDVVALATVAQVSMSSRRHLAAVHRCVAGLSLIHI